MSGRASRGAGMLITLALAGMAMLFLAFLSEEASSPAHLVFGLAGAGGMGWLLLRGPVGKAIAGMLEGTDPGADPMLAMRVAELEDRLQEVSLETQRLMEIEDRLEFAERLMAERGLLPRGGDDGR